ncbi:MAG: hypothetical protein H5U07_08750 [Candidatus Aminicenantes bacterium]|nr:hypothetical protein [Candidatus Aminicenantes bacterium]
MDERKILNFFRQAAVILRDFLPPSASVIGPLVYALAVWGLKQQASYREKIDSLKVWLLPEILVHKPDDFILNFFASNEALKQAYQDEIAASDLKTLHQHFAVLYPLLGLQDPFLEALFWPEIECGNFKEIVAQYKPKVEKALQEIKAAEAREDFWPALGRIFSGLVELGWQALSEGEVRSWLKQWLKDQGIQ